MKAHWSDFKLGLFVLVGVALFLTALLVFGATRVFEGKTIEETYVAGSAEGLKPGALVMLRGVPVGEVTGVNFSWNEYLVSDPRYVVVQFSLRNNVSLISPGKGFQQRMQDEIRKGLRARIKSQGLAGAPFLSLEYPPDVTNYPALPFPWKPRHMYIPSAPGQFTEIMASFNETMEDIKSINFKELSAKVQRDLTAGERLMNHLNQANIGDLGTNATALLGEFNRVGSNVNTLVDQLRELSTRLNAFVGQAAPAGNTHNLQQLSANTDQLLLQLRATVDRLGAITGSLNTSSLNQTLEHARQATADLEQVARELKRYPAGALFGRPPPPARSVEPTGR